MCGFYMRRVFQSCYKFKKKKYGTERVFNVVAHRVSCVNHAEVAHDCMLESKLLSITDDFEAGDMAQGLETLDALPEDPASTR